MSILGLTIDYGPFGFLDTYDPQFVANASDEGGRYRFEAQPSICYWNLARFAEALQSAGLPLDESKADLEALYFPTYEHEYFAGLRAKVRARGDSKRAWRRLYSRLIGPRSSL